MADMDFFDDYWPILCLVFGCFLMVVGIASTSADTSDDEQACRDHGGTYVKVFEKDAYYCKGAR